MNNPKSLGLTLGLVIGTVLVWLGLWQAAVVGILGFTGWLVGKFIVGELPILDSLLERFVENRDREHME